MYVTLITYTARTVGRLNSAMSHPGFAYRAILSAGNPASAPGIPIHVILFRRALFLGLALDLVCLLLNAFMAFCGSRLFQRNRVFAEQHLPEEAEAEQHQRGVVGEDTAAFFGGEVYSLPWAQT